MADAKRRRARQRGAASVEYALVTGVVITALFVAPVNADGQTALEFVLEALRGFQRNTTYLLSLP